MDNVRFNTLFRMQINYQVLCMRLDVQSRIANLIVCPSIFSMSMSRWVLYLYEIPENCIHASYNSWQAIIFYSCSQHWHHLANIYLKLHKFTNLRAYTHRETQDGKHPVHCFHCTDEYFEICLNTWIIHIVKILIPTAVTAKIQTGVQRSCEAALKHDNYFYSSTFSCSKYLL